MTWSKASPGFSDWSHQTLNPRARALPQSDARWPGLRGCRKGRCRAFNGTRNRPCRRVCRNPPHAAGAEVVHQAQVAQQVLESRVGAQIAHHRAPDIDTTARLSDHWQRAAPPRSGSRVAERAREYREKDIHRASWLAGSSNALRIARAPPRARARPARACPAGLLRQIHRSVIPMKARNAAGQGRCAPGLCSHRRRKEFRPRSRHFDRPFSGLALARRMRPRMPAAE